VDKRFRRVEYPRRHNRGGKMSDEYKCSQCGDELTERYWHCHYAGDDEENRVCGEGGCWADWIQFNMTEIEMREEE
jgi:hypothetical protein